MEPLVKVENVSVIYNEGEGIKEVTALKDINIEIYPEEYVVFFGPSGCGKSTLMNVIAGLERVAHGRVIVCGQDLAKLSDEEMAIYHRRQMGFIFQSYNLISTLTVGENIALPQMFDGLSRSEYMEHAVALANRFGIGEHVKKIPSELSGGQQQRVGVARSLINNPALLLADEPTGNLDSKNVRIVLDLFQEFNLKDKRTILYVTHSPTHLSEADRIFYLKDGQIISEARNKERIINKNIGEEKEENPIVREVREEMVKRIEADEKIVAEIKAGSPTISELLQQPPEPHPGFAAEKMAEFAMGIPREQMIRRIEEIIDEHIRGLLTGYEMVMQLDSSYFGGGAGLNRRTAERIGEIIEHLIANADTVRHLETLPETSAGGTISYFTESLAASMRLKLDTDERTNMEALLKNRITNRIGPVKLRRLLHENAQNGGVGLRAETARKISLYIELILLVAHHMREQKLKQYESKPQPASQTLKPKL